MYFVYIIRSQKDGSYYVGHAADVKNRLADDQEEYLPQVTRKIC